MIKIWNAIDGKKLITGLLVAILTAAAKIIQMKYPMVGALITDDMILGAAVGAATFISVGVTHKVVKAVKK